ncbi:MAG: glycoside hydrolase family 38 C-terminal domain-containing protein [Fimbriimonas sp.]|nr:glycoside hydrolase family 38 C-terminal domain-containing protein [Fimbriimonas sp.]
MRFRRSLASLSLAVMFPWLLASPGTQQTFTTKSTCLAFVATNLAKGNGNFYEYLRFSNLQTTIRDGDVFVYSVFLDPSNPVAKGGIDINFQDDGGALRDLGLTDQNGILAHGDGVLTPAIGHWYTRRIALSDAKGRKTADFELADEGDIDGRYAQFVADVYIEHADGTKTWVYESGSPQVLETDNVNGYSRSPACIAIDRSSVDSAKDLGKLIENVLGTAQELAKLDEIRKDIDLARKYVARNPDPGLEGHIREAEGMLAQIRSRNATTDEIEAVLHTARHALSHTHPVMQKYTGHLVGHAHIDLQWLWEWQEGIVFSHDTFNQAVKFMDEFPGFSFSQSSSCLYQTTEEHYPELFKKIQEKVKKGQWEIVGGRVCEGDTNMISPESHARHFLYGQRYFREKFGKTAIVGWEPDTFGHTAQMPQILKLGGCKYYYFCRGGKGKPLFWWTALDGTRVLAFDEPANGSWYNSDLSYRQFQEMLNFEESTGSKNDLWVYGVGNHGGGPTREQIQTALEWMKDPSKPTVRFSTATQFFKKLESYDLSKIPVLNTDLNPVFDGCYTSHSEIKQLNRNAEALTTSAEAVATVASLQGFQYPKESFRRNWEDICFNHHHDTLPGSGIHAPYDRTKVELGRVIADDQDIIIRAMEMLTVRVTPVPGGLSTMVFNPTGWSRGGWVETYLVKSGWDQGDDLDLNGCVAIGPDGKQYPIEVLDVPSRRVRFWAGDVPSFGYKVFHLTSGASPKPAIQVRDDGYTVDTDRFTVEFDREHGGIKRLTDKRSHHEFAGAGGLGMLEAHYERAGGMSAWVLGHIDKVERVHLVSSDVKRGSQGVNLAFHYQLDPNNEISKPTTVTQTFHIDSQSDQIPVDVDCNWRAIGKDGSENPLLRVVFDTAIDKPTATYEVPFGSIERPTDGIEYPALEWADMGGNGFGLSIFNDSKHGHSASGSTLRLSLIRSSFSPDPVPNPGRHHWRYAIVPHSGDWKQANIVEKAADFNQPLIEATVPFDAKGAAPLQYSPVSVTDPNLVPTCLKKSEDGGDLVVRMYESTGKPSNSGLKLNVPFTKATWVNFLEDDLANAKTANGVVSAPARGFEIKTVKIKLTK